MTSTIALKKTTDTSTFARYMPFADGREVIVRRGTELGFRYGLELSRRLVKIGSGEFPLVRVISILSPPPMRLWRWLFWPGAAKQYKPISDVLFLPDAEVLLRRRPKGFSDAEVEQILQTISVQ